MKVFAASVAVVMSLMILNTSFAMTLTLREALYERYETTDLNLPINEYIQQMTAGFSLDEIQEELVGALSDSERVHATQVARRVGHMIEKGGIRDGYDLLFQSQDGVMTAALNESPLGVGLLWIAVLKAIKTQRQDQPQPAKKACPKSESGVPCPKTLVPAEASASAPQVR